MCAASATPYLFDLSIRPEECYNLPLRTVHPPGMNEGFNPYKTLVNVSCWCVAKHDPLDCNLWPALDNLILAMST